MRRLPRWSVTWPVRPAGLYTQVVRAVDASDAVRVAAELEWPVEVAFACTPEVWRVRWPYRLRSRHVAGPHLPEPVGRRDVR